MAPDDAAHELRKNRGRASLRDGGTYPCDGAAGVLCAIRIGDRWFARRGGIRMRGGEGLESTAPGTGAHGQAVALPGDGAADGPLAGPANLSNRERKCGLCRVVRESRSREPRRNKRHNLPDELLRAFSECLPL